MSNRGKISNRTLNFWEQKSYTAGLSPVDSTPESTNTTSNNESKPSTTPMEDEIKNTENKKTSQISNSQTPIPTPPVSNSTVIQSAKKINTPTGNATAGISTEIVQQPVQQTIAVTQTISKLPPAVPFTQTNPQNQGNSQPRGGKAPAPGMQRGGSFSDRGMLRGGSQRGGGGVRGSPVQRGLGKSNSFRGGGP